MQYLQYVPPQYAGVAMGAMAAGYGFKKWYKGRGNSTRAIKAPPRAYRRRSRRVPRKFKKNLLAFKENKFLNNTSLTGSPVQGTFIVNYITGIS